jgi:hypothetical protein
MCGGGDEVIIHKFGNNSGENDSGRISRTQQDYQILIISSEQIKYSDKSCCILLILTINRAPSTVTSFVY